MNNHIDDFTESHYRNLLKVAKVNYEFKKYDQFQSEGKFVLWRHDIDMSVHRAVQLARIETEEGVSSTFFVHMHSEYYNALELDTKHLLREIYSMNHDIGIHFDPYFYQISTKKELEKFLLLEKGYLEQVLDIEIRSFSFHQPDRGGWLNLGAQEVAGLINAYSSYFKNHFDYCSDSNGYWRYRRLYDVLAEAKSEKLQVLTHPEWWTPEAMSPRKRVTRCIEGRAQKSHQEYDNQMARDGRLNIK